MITANENGVIKNLTGRSEAGVILSATSVTLNKRNQTTRVVTASNTGDLSVTSSDPTLAMAYVDGSDIVITSPNRKDGVCIITVYIAENVDTRAGIITITVNCEFTDIVSWPNGTDEEIAAMVAASDAGTIDLSLYWSVGDEHVTLLSAMDATGVGESHVSQNVILVLAHRGGYKFTDGKTCAFVVTQKNALTEQGYMNSTNTNAGSWKNCARRTWSNGPYRMSFSDAIRPIFKQIQVTTATEYNASTVTVTEDYFTLAAEAEVFGKKTYSTDAEAAALFQFTYYMTAANRIKTLGGGSACHWWLRSPYASGSNNFCCVNGNGAAYGYYGASYTFGLAPVGAI